MMLSGQIRCVVIRVPQHVGATDSSRRQHDPLPWADPYILGLIARLQREVRMERQAQNNLQWQDAYFEFEDRLYGLGDSPGRESPSAYKDPCFDEEEFAAETMPGDALPPTPLNTAGPSPEDDEFDGRPQASKRPRHPK